MSISGTIGRGLVLALACASAGTSAVPPEPAVSSRLRVLATHAADRSARAALRRYAESARSPEQKGLAFFTLGYREYESEEYEVALGDLRRAAGTGFSLLDYAQYYRALSARETGQPDDVQSALEGFSARHPQSPLRIESLELLATVLLEVGQAERALGILTAEPSVRQRPALALLLARAYQETERPAAAAAAFQEVYNAFPASSESEAVKDSLDELRTQLGERFPEVPIEIRTARARILYRRHRYSDAIDEYNLLLRSYPQNRHAGRWRIGQARSLMGLRRIAQAIEVLQTGIARDPEGDAERLATLVEIYRRREDAPAMLRALNELAERYPRSLSYAAALSEAGNRFVRDGDWAKASVYYRRLLVTFPRSELAPEASWRVAWASYLEGDSSRAAEALQGHLKRYPNSPRIPSVLYWLGRLAEERGALAEALFLYESLQRRFGNNFYAVQAETRLKKPHFRGIAEVSQIQSSVAALAAGIPPRDGPSVLPCTARAKSELAAPFETLQSLGLEDLAERHLKLVLADHPAHPEVSLVLGRKLAEDGRVDLALFAVQKVVPGYPDYGFSELPREVWHLLYPRRYQSLVRRYARAQGLDSNLVMGLIRQESAFNPRATSRANARGLMQVLPRSVSRSRRRRRTAARRLYDPSYNLRFGCAYLRARLKSFDGKVEQALAAYHAGPTRVRRWVEGREFSEPAEFLESIPIPATRAYVERVLRDAAIYRHLTAGTAAFADCRASSASLGGE